MNPHYTVEDGYIENLFAERRKIDFDELYYFHPFGHHCLGFDKDNEQFEIGMNIGEVADLILSKGFSRCNDNCIINNKHIKRFLPKKAGDNNHYILLDNGKLICCSRRKFTPLKNFLKRVLVLVNKDENKNRQM